MTDSEIVNAFDSWAGEMHARLECRLSEMDETGGMDHLSDSGYWKTMCVAAWADKQLPEQVVGVALMERLACLLRETDAAEDEEDVPPQSDELRARIRELWNAQVPV